MAVSKPAADQGFVYKMNGPAKLFPPTDFGPAGSWSTGPNGFPRGVYVAPTTFVENEGVRHTLTLDAGYSYVSMGEWNWEYIYGDGTPSLDGSAGVLFAGGDRTPASGIPVSGTSTYDARTFDPFIKASFALTADFGQRTMSTRIDQDYAYNFDGDIMDYPTAFGIHVAGSAPFTNDGLFNIPLSGSVNWANSYAINTPVAPTAEPVSGTMNGAFFGPHAEQVGGVFFLDRAGGARLMQDAFVGRQPNP